MEFFPLLFPSLKKVARNLMLSSTSGSPFLAGVQVPFFTASAASLGQECLAAPAEATSDAWDCRRSAARAEKHATMPLSTAQDAPLGALLTCT
eukprot:CAMPEP_0117688666 /NCGR_PEP_ID=MMETSP0804-20121206/23979_1 /TAXON_ID=1074897 /ORGANISM="Tetraselmis astigmatica, Strain CCMP880" /LENGTH=92 /DNA_ID=CAMNT_0005501189 /DNA_START=188 /DNA_END=462 /DNA_ORIENTATION=+